MRLLVNIDHIATLRNARGEGYPDPVEAAQRCEQAGAAGIVFHLRHDRRHIRDDDVYRLKKIVKGTLDFEMAASEEMIDICLDIQPELVTLVPEGREELTTEGGLDMAEVFDDFKTRVVPRFKDNGIEISLFLDPIKSDINMASELGVEAIELHTGPYANADGPEAKEKELHRLKEAAEMAQELSLKVNAGHGLNLQNLPKLVSSIPYLNDISIGHALVSRSVFDGLDSVIGQYLTIIKQQTLA